MVETLKYRHWSYKQHMFLLWMVDNCAIGVRCGVLGNKKYFRKNKGVQGLLTLSGNFRTISLTTSVWPWAASLTSLSGPVSVKCNSTS